MWQVGVIGMMGQHEHGQGCFFYQFDLKEMVPAAHLLRGIAHFLDLSRLRKHLASCQRAT
jgi:hypothetical protein